MDYLQFIKDKPVLYGQIRVNKNSKIGMFKPVFNRYSNKIDYRYYSPKGNAGSGGFTTTLAWKLLVRGALSTNPDFGKPENYI